MCKVFDVIFCGFVFVVVVVVGGGGGGDLELGGTAWGVEGVDHCTYLQKG